MITRGWEMSTKPEKRAIDFTNIGPIDLQGNPRELHISELMTGREMSPRGLRLAMETWMANSGVAARATTEPKNASEPLERRELQLEWGNESDPLPVYWGWAGRIPLGALTLVGGREGTGKSTFCAWLAAQVTRGRLPGEWSGRPRRVLYVASEDSWAGMILPRLIAAGVDRRLVARVTMATLDSDHGLLNLPQDNAQLDEAIRKHDVGLVVIDPVMSVMDERINENANRQARKVLDALAAIAERNGAMICGIAHFNKATGSDATMRFSASKAFTDVPRAVFAFATDAATGSRIMSQTKNSYGPSRDSHTYELEPVTVPTRHDRPASVSRFVFTGESAHSVDDILAAEHAGPTPNSARARAMAGLIELFRTSGEEKDSGYLRVWASDVENARIAWDVSVGTVSNASRELGVSSGRDGEGRWWRQIDKAVIDRATP